ncbi:P63C domain-containing protein [Mucilaginibacter oryzae]|uniref:P63C domain-containing protein n=1 Tax=Mucilaginibacter oryzae TaxID=468058 RepID=A0A316HDJ7_9SPHI|nr:P63C domain-containing protein [Mucilaginibacter oryzae]PWK79299.1 P63C domain-containing protein [Mucilaginibacter oryzae]
MSKILKAAYGSDKTPLKLGAVEIPCYVLEDGTRVLSGRAMQKALGYEGSSGDWLKNFIANKNINNNIPPEILAGILKPIKFKRVDAGGSQPTTYGYDATALIDLCDALITLNKAGILRDNQKIFAEQAEVIIRSVAKVGIIALIDEATGYQHNREKDELQKILSAYIAAELLPWQKRFPDEFYQEIFRLNGWDYTVNGIQNRPGVIGTWTKKLIYNLLPKGVLEELERKTPISQAGNRTARFHQSLTLDIGEPHLEKQLISVITLMNISSNWDEFLRLFGKKFQKDLMQLSVQPKFKKSTPKVSAKQYLMFEPGQTDLFGKPIGQIPEEEKPLSDFNTNLKTALSFNPKKEE